MCTRIAANDPPSRGQKAAIPIYGKTGICVSVLALAESGLTTSPIASIKKENYYCAGPTLSTTKTSPAFLSAGYRHHSLFKRERKKHVSDTKQDVLTCDDCKNEVARDDEFCPNCGRVFVVNLKCSNHADVEASGVCIICCLPFCRKCGGRVNKLFLCSDHEDYEIYEGRARVYGVSDEVTAQYAQACLKTGGLHPFLYSRKASPISIGGPDHTTFRASGEYDGHIINEVKVLVPCQEVLRAEKLLRELEFKEK